MKALSQLNNVEKAAILFSLFPEEMPALVDFIKGMSEAITEDSEYHRREWKNGLFTFDFWLRLATDAGNRIERYGTKLHRNKRLFTDQLFDGYAACFAVHCIEVYITTRQHRNKEFVHGAKMLFGI